MIARLFFYLSIPFLLSSCLIADEFFLPEEDPYIPLQTQCENSVKKEITEKNIGFTYLPYGFSEIIIHKPSALYDLDSLKNLPNNNSQKDSLIQAKENEIHQKRIERSIEIDHFFTLTDSLGETKVFEMNYRLNDTLAVYSASPLLITPIEQELLDILPYYFYEYTIFKDGSYEECKNRSVQFYRFFKSYLNEIESPQDRALFLLHTLSLVKTIKANGTFNQDQQLQDMVKNFFNETPNGPTKYQPLLFSPLKEISQELSTPDKSFYFFHTFIHEDSIGSSDTSGVQIVFTKYYQIREMNQLAKPFAPYFREL